MKKGIFYLLFVCFLVFVSFSAFSDSHTIPLDFTTWDSYTANGSEILSVTPSEATFRILRTNTGPKGDPKNQSYAYLISGLISISFDWEKIIIEGTWWKDKKSGENYQEMVFFTFAKEPSVIHGSGNTNYIYTIYEDWNKILRCDDVGETPNVRTEKRISREMPITPIRFRLIIQRAIPRGKPMWAYWEEESDGHWEKVYEQECSNMFNDTSRDKLYFKIGGWTSWEYPVSSILYFKDFRIKVYTPQEIQERLGNVVLKRK